MSTLFPQQRGKGAKRMFPNVYAALESKDVKKMVVSFAG
jgi:hypothetical protein